MAKPNPKPKRRDPTRIVQSNRRTKRRGGGRTSKGLRPSRPSNTSYRATTRDLLKTFPDLPTGPSGRRHPRGQRGSELNGQQKSGIHVEYSVPQLNAQKQSDFHIESNHSQVNSLRQFDYNTEPLGIVVDAPRSYVEQDDDFNSDDDGGIFSGNSCGSSADCSDDEPMSVLPHSSRRLIDLPNKIWQMILLHLHPVELARLRTSSSFFNTLLQRDIIWRNSRTIHLQDFPKPVLGLTEVEMFRLLLSDDCMLCNGDIETRVYWPFRVRCCRTCLQTHSKKEFLLKSGSDSISEELLEALSFGMVDLRDHWIPHPKSYQPDIGMYRVFWTQDLHDIKRRYEEAKDMLIEDEWLKGMRCERDAQIHEIERIEKFETHRLVDLIRSDPLLNCSSVANSTRHMVFQNPSSGDSANQIQEARPKYPRQRHQKRCPELDQRLPPEAHRFPAYQAAASSNSSQNETSLGSLRAHASRDRPEVDEREQELSAPERHHFMVRSESGLLHDGPPPLVGIQSWVGMPEKMQTQVWHRAKLINYAEEIIFKWKGKILPDTVPHFATDVLQHCREKYLADDSSLRRSLTLEDMKYIFDTKIRPLAHPHRREMFLCDGCPNNPRWWGFESLVQHFCAKHTYSSRGRQAKVNWRSEWPKTGPFRSGFDNTQLDMINNGKLATPHHMPFALVGSSSSWWAQRLNQPPITPHQNSIHFNRGGTGVGQIDVLAQEAHNAWYQLSNIKNMIASIHVHFVITRTSRSFKTKFSESLSLSSFLGALCEHPLMEPFKSVNGLGCKQCQRYPEKNADGISKADRIFTLVSLLYHFDTVHLKRTMSVPDWTNDMVNLPNLRTVSALANSEGIIPAERCLFEEMFPGICINGSKHIEGNDSGRTVSFRTHRTQLQAMQERHQTERGMNLGPEISISKDRLSRIDFGDSQPPSGGIRPIRESLEMSTSDVESARHESYLRGTHDINQHVNHLPPVISLSGMESRRPSRVHSEIMSINVHSYLASRDEGFSRNRHDSRGVGNAHEKNESHRIRRPSAADFMDGHGHTIHMTGMNKRDDTRYDRHADIERYLSTGDSRSRSRSPIDGSRYRNPYSNSGRERIPAVDTLFNDRRYSDYQAGVHPLPPFYDNDETNSFRNSYETRADHGLYTLSHGPPQSIPPHPAQFYGHRYEAMPKPGNPTDSLWPPILPSLSTGRIMTGDGYDRQFYGQY